MGKLTAKRRDYIEFCLLMHNWTKEQLKAGVMAADIANGFYRKYVDSGYEENYVYGPCHGTGMIEVEPPWMETSSEYPLEENMTFQVDTFVTAPGFGVRWEVGGVVIKNGFELLCHPVGKIYELGY
jgi:Xaa-Pro aminopeptidase